MVKNDCPIGQRFVYVAVLVNINKHLGGMLTFCKKFD